MNVAMTGAGSIVARSVLGLLDRDPCVECVFALDIRPLQGVFSAKVRYQRADVRDIDSLRSAFSAADAVIHLAFVVADNVPDRPTIEAINLGGSQRVIQAAADFGVGKVVYMSSVAAYGAVPGNPPVLTEESPLRGLENKKDFYYSYSKAAVETAMDEFVRSHPGLIVTRFRAPIVVGPNVLEHTDNLFFLSQLARPSRSFWGFQPEGANGSLLQYVHEEDLARAIQFALHNEMPGAFNIAGEPLDFEGFLRQKGKIFRRIPWTGANALACLLSPLSGRARLARSWLVSARYRNIMDSSKLMRSGFKEPLRTTLQCVEEVVAYYEGHRAGKGDRLRDQENPRR